MRADEVNMTLEDALDKATPGLRNRMLKSVELLRKSERMALRLDSENGFHLAFSGGKDSQALYHMARLAGVRFRAFMSLTSVDPPEVIRFVKREYPDVGLIKPGMSIFDMARRKRILPTMRFRWCCAEYKETHGAGKVTLTGIRKEESARRAKRDEVEMHGHKFSGNFDQWSAHEENMVTCVGGKDKILVSPIIYWTARDVWQFLDKVMEVPHCGLYDQGHTRIGCILCPMTGMRTKVSDMRRWPHVRRNWLKVCQYLIDNGDNEFTDAEEFFDWWIRGKSRARWRADNRLQQRIDFDFNG